MSKGASIAAIVPLYNGERFIEAALASIMAQTLQPKEIVVVDDGSTDGGPAAVDQLQRRGAPITFLRKDNGGQSSARNAGVARSRSAMIALLDQDDFWYPDHLAQLAALLLEDDSNQTGWAYSNLDLVDSEGRTIERGALGKLAGTHPKRCLEDCLSSDMFILPSASLITREAFEAVGGFDEALSGYEDDDIFLRMFCAGFRHSYLDCSLSGWRQHSGRASYSPKMAQSRMHYFDKLSRRFPDEPAHGRFPTRDIIAPRFIRPVVGDLRSAVLRRDGLAVEASRRDLRAIARYCKPGRGLLLSTIELGSRSYRLTRLADSLLQMRRSAAAN